MKNYNCVTSNNRVHRNECRSVWRYHGKREDKWGKNTLITTDGAS